MAAVSAAVFRVSCIMVWRVIVVCGNDGNVILNVRGVLVILFSTLMLCCMVSCGLFLLFETNEQMHLRVIPERGNGDGWCV